MKLAMNGALTIGTLDGANVEIRQAVGEENFFLFGLTAEEVLDVQRTGYRPREIYEKNDRLREVIDLVANGFFSEDDPELFRPLTDHLLDHDTWMLFADFDAYVTCHQKVSEAFVDQGSWHAKAVQNIAHVGPFSSDRTIREYAREIWQAQPVKIDLRPYESSLNVAPSE
jgi:starch phosphorylase